MNFEKYVNHLPYPERVSRPSSHLCKTSSDYIQYASDLKKWEETQVERNQQLKAYQEEETRLRDEFKKDAIEESGFASHPKADKIYDFAYDERHSNGYSEVFNFLIDLAEVFL